MKSSFGKYAGDNLYSQFKNGDVSESRAAVIADVARGDEGLEAAGIRAAKNGMPVSQLAEFMKVLKNTPREKTEQGDLFGFDDSAINTAETLAKFAAKHIREVKEKVNAAKAAIKNPDAARKLGVRVGRDAEKLLAQAQKEAALWDQWYTNPELSAQLRKEAGLEAPPQAAQVEGMREEAGGGEGKIGNWCHSMYLIWRQCIATKLFLICDRLTIEITDDILSLSVEQV